MRVVLDTNVVVSALVWGGTPLRLIEAAADGDAVLFTSPALLSELQTVLAREHIATRLQARRSSVDEALSLYAMLAVSVLPTATPRVVPRDAADDHVIAAAVAAEAEILVTGDRELLHLQRHGRFSIVSPAEAVARIGRLNPSTA